MADDDLLFSTASRLAALIRAGKLSPVTLMTEVLDAAKRAQPVLNPFVTLLEERATAEAREAEQAGDWTVSLECYESALRCLPAEGDARRAAELLRWIGSVHRERGGTLAIAATVRAPGVITTGDELRPAGAED